MASNTNAGNVSLAGGIHLQITPEIRAQLEKENQRRLKRNEDRRSRRESNNGDDVSEDEGDGIMSLLTDTLESESPLVRKDATVALFPVPRAPSKKKEGIIFTDIEAEGREFTMHDDSIPESVTLMAKCHRTPPLSLFLGQSLDRIKSGRDVKYVKVGSGEFANVKLLDISSFPTDVSLDHSQWVQAYNTFLNFAANTMGQRIYAGFLAHWDTMMKDQHFNQWFEAYKFFDEKIRQRFFTSPFIIDPTSVQYNSALQEAKLRMSISSSSFQTTECQFPASGDDEYPQN